MWFSEKGPSDEPVYRRPLPSGGYVAISTESVQPLFAEARIRGRVVVERRSEARRSGHLPPVVAVAESKHLEEILEVLLPVAESDELLTQTLERRVTMPITRRRGPSEG